MASVACLALTVVVTVLRAAEAQQVDADGPGQSTHRIFSPNPPACAAEVADDLKHFTDIGTGIVTLTTKCAMNGGWRDVAGRTQFHSKFTCAGALIDTIQQCADTASSTMALVFDCFNDNQACGQSIAAVISNFLDVAAALLSATKTCEPMQQDEVISGWKCWADTFKATQRIVQAAKFIDVAISTCNIPDMSAFGPAPGAAAAGNATGNAIGDANDTISSREYHHDLIAQESLDEQDDLAPNWLRMEHQPTPFTGAAENFQVAPVERRLQQRSGESSAAFVRRLGAQLTALRGALLPARGAQRRAGNDLGEVPLPEIQV